MKASIPFWKTTEYLERKINEREKWWENLYKMRVYLSYERLLFLILRNQAPLRKFNKLNTISLEYFNSTPVKKLDHVWYENISILNKLNDKMAFILNQDDGMDGRFKYACYAFAMGWMNLAINSSYLVKAEQNLYDGYSKEWVKFKANTFNGELLKTFPDFSQEIRYTAAQKLYEDHFLKPVHYKKWIASRNDIYRELSYHKGKKDRIIESSILHSIFELPLYPVQIKKDGAPEERPLWDLSISELSEKPEIFKRAMAALTINDLAPNREHTWDGGQTVTYPYVEEVGEQSGLSPLGEMEVSAMILGGKLKDENEWLQVEMNQLYLEDKLNSLNLTPRERFIIEAKLSGKTPTGTPGSVKAALSKLKKKIRKK